MEEKRVGYRIVGTIKEIRGECGAGHKTGDQFELSAYEADGLCGFFIHDCLLPFPCYLSPCLHILINTELLKILTKHLSVSISYLTIKTSLKVGFSVNSPLPGWLLFISPQRQTNGKPTLKGVIIRLFAIS